MILRAAKVVKRRVRRLRRRLRYATPLYVLDPERVLARRFEGTFPTDPEGLLRLANYALDSQTALNRDAVVYSFGVGADIEFEKEVVRRFGCRVYLFDPTPVSVRFMNEHHAADEPFAFSPVGLWTSDSVQRFFEPKAGGSASVVRTSGEGGWFDAQCSTLRSLMARNGHDHVDLLKMDIEGAALPVMEQMVEQGIFPTQVVAEFERPRGDIDELADYFVRVRKLCDAMKDHNYDVAVIPRDRAKYYSIELLFVRKSVTRHAAS